MSIILRPHQTNAYNIIKSQSERGEQNTYISMCTGSGKTYVFTKFILDNPGDVFILVEPTLSLVDQVHSDYLQKYRIKSIVVCSPDDGDESDDDIIPKNSTRTADFPSQDIDSIFEDTRVALTTYKSFPIVFQTMLDNGVCPTIIFDESHRITNECQDILDDRAEEYPHAIYFSATHKDEITPHFMYTMWEAMNDGYCKPFNLHVVKNNTNSILSAIHESPNKHCMFFTAYSESDKDGKNNVPKAVEMVCKYAKSLGIKVWVKGITADTPRSERKKILREFDSPIHSKPHDMYIIVSCKTIGEGTDTKNCDTVVFLDHTKSHIDIIQRMGRAARLRRDKDGNYLPKELQTPGSVYIPVDIDEDFLNDKSREEKDEYIRANLDKFGMITNVYIALQQHDPHMYRMCIYYPVVYDKAQEMGKRLVRVEEGEDTLLECASMATGIPKEDIASKVKDKNSVEEVSNAVDRPISVYDMKADKETVVGEDKGKEPIQMMKRTDGHFDMLVDKGKEDKVSEKVREGVERTEEEVKDVRRKRRIHTNPEFRILLDVVETRVVYEIEGVGDIDKEERDMKFARDLVKFYRENGRYPIQQSKDEEEKRMGIRLNSWRGFMRGRAKRSKPHPNAIEYLNANCPNWCPYMEEKEESDMQFAMEVEIYLRKNERYPSTNSKYEDEKSIGHRLSRWRGFMRGNGSTKPHPKAIE